MNKIIELFRPHICGKNLIEISCLKDTTVRLYIGMVYKYAEYAKQQLHIRMVETQTCHIHKWMYHLKTKGKNCYFMKDCKISLNRFFAFLVKMGYIKKNPAAALPRIKIPRSSSNKPLATEKISKILKSFDRNKWLGMRNFTIVSILWALGLRVNELLNMKRKDINLDYDPEHKTGTLLVHGKGDRERTLFIVDTLYATLGENPGIIPRFSAR
jgi:site-specific recombinase XerD